MKKIILALCFSILVGCVSSPPTDEISKADFGNLPSNHQDLVKEKLGTTLKDPYSAHYNFGLVGKAWCKSGFTTYYGWLIPVTVNAKNSYGGYVGNTPMAFLYTKGQVIDFTASYQVGGCGIVH
ncbi:hypothetical protein EFZ10_06250 [Tatumella sp. TA1]|nr:hypothetical protein EFZ10_06250 [Tatumella sp. TA1]